MPRYELVEGTSNKFWQIDLDQTSFTTTYGRIGTRGQCTEKTFPSAAKAKLEHDKLIAEKVKKGYVLVDAGPAPAPPAVASAPTKAAPAPTVVETASPPPSAPAPPADVPRAEPGRGAVRVTPELAARAARERHYHLDTRPVSAPSAATAYRDLRGFLQSGRAPALLQAGLAATSEKLRPRTEAVLAAYARPEPQTLDPQVEADALVVFNAVRMRFDTRSAGNTVSEVLVELWVGHAGLCFALDVLVRSVRAVSMHQQGGLAPLILMPAGDWIAGVRRLRGRVDYPLRARLLAATPAERAEARAHAERLRGEGDLLARSALACIFLDPAWIDADLRARASTSRDAVFTPSALAHASDGDALEAYFSSAPPAEALALPPGFQDKPFTAWLLATLGERAVPALTTWLARSLEISAPMKHSPGLAKVVNLIDVLQFTEGFEEVVRLAARVLAWSSGAKLAKSDDPRPAAIAILRASPALAAPVVEAAAKEKRNAWAREPQQQLARADEATTRAADVASDDEVPAALKAARRFDRPGFWTPASFRAPTTRAGRRLPASAVDALGALLASGDRATLAVVKEELDAASLAAFGWDLFEAWAAQGSPPKERWAFTALGAIGDDDTARRLTPLIRAWPGQSQHQRAAAGLDVLTDIGSDVALMMLNGIAQKLKFKALQDKARTKMTEVARRLRLTPEQLADRLIPDLGLDPDGSRTLDFGARSFRVGFDEALAPFVLDEDDVRLKELPKPGAKDDPALAAAALAAWKLMKKDARAVADLQILRLERAMVTGKRFDARHFLDLFVRHPLLVHLVRRLVWATLADDGSIGATFRVAEDRTLATARDEPYVLPEGARVGVPHPLLLTGADLTAWTRLFAEYEIVQPFEQLGRACHELEYDAVAARFNDRVVPTKNVLGLLRRGWRKDEVMDAGVVGTISKRFDDYAEVTLLLDPGLAVGFVDGSQTVSLVDVGFHNPHRSRVVRSEVIRDLELLVAS